MTAFEGLRLPTRRRDWRLMGRTVRLVLSLPRYAVLTVGYAWLGLSVFVFARNLGILRQVIVLGDLPPANRARVFTEMYPGLGTAYTVEQTAVLVATAVLVGINLTLLTYHVREHRLDLRDGYGSFTGIVLGTLGGGCAACGSAVFAGILSVVGASGLLAGLPLDGLEFALAAVGLLVLSIYWLAEGMRGGAIAGRPVDTP